MGYLLKIILRKKWQKMDIDYNFTKQIKDIGFSFKKMEKELNNANINLSKIVKKIENMVDYIKEMDGNVKTIILPDIHGRDFWKRTVKKNLYDRYIFLGDYFDPYPNENHSFNDTMKNFMEILEFKKSNPDKVVLLLGNHDLGYFDKRICSCRQYRGPEYEDVINVLTDNIHLFDICCDEIINNKHFVFSHAGILRDWDEEVRRTFKIEKNVEGDKPISCTEYNKLFHDSILNKDVFNNLLNMISYYRGGYDMYGSIVWADIREFANKYYGEKKIENKSSFSDIIQIVGHTQLAENAISINDKVYCLDVRQPFYIDVEGNVRNYITNSIVTYKI